MKRILPFLLILSCSGPSGFILEGSIEVQDGRDWIYLRIYDEVYNLIDSAVVRLGMKTIPYDEEKYAYFRDSLGINPGHPYTVTAWTGEHACTLSVTLPLEFEAQIPAAGEVNSPFSITWESSGVPDEWRVVIFHGDIVVFEEILGGEEDSVWVPGSSFYEAGDYTVYLYAINYGEAKGDVVDFVFAGIVSTRGNLKVSE